MERTITTLSYEATEREGERLAQQLNGTETIALFGDLGAGKTAFVRGLAKGLNIDQREISSPTFAIMHEHMGKYRLCHYDMYRVTTWEDLDSTGFPESVGRCVNAVEWSENIENALPYPRWNVTITKGEGEDERQIVEQYIISED